MVILDEHGEMMMVLGEHGGDDSGIGYIYGNYAGHW